LIREVFSSEGLLAEVKRALAKRMLNAKMDQRLEGETAAAPQTGRRDKKAEPIADAPERFTDGDGWKRIFCRCVAGEKCAAL
jgi:hypothetical protein